MYAIRSYYGQTSGQCTSLGQAQPAQQADFGHAPVEFGQESFHGGGAGGGAIAKSLSQFGLHFQMKDIILAPAGAMQGRTHRNNFV